jgi:hypothetical protein
MKNTYLFAPHGYLKSSLGEDMLVIVSIIKWYCLPVRMKVFIHLQIKPYISDGSPLLHFANDRINGVLVLLLTEHFS